MNGVAAPLSFAPVKQPQFPVRVPSAMVDPCAAIIGQTIEAIPVLLPVVLDLEDRIFQGIAGRRDSTCIPGQGTGQDRLSQ